MPVVGSPPAPRPCGPAAGPSLLASLQKLHVQNRAAGRSRSPTEPGSPLAWGLGFGDAAAGRGEPPRPGRRPQPHRLGPCDKVLRALLVELGLDRADELPEPWLGHHEFDSPSDLPAG
ncbi:CITE1 protein, partial [Pachycephala philippinensis]|nr:CITE1 protein [Pachycephala philippinensis]